MSVAVPVIDYLDTTNKLIYLLAGCRAYHPVDDIYEEVRYRRRTDDAMRWFQVPVTAAGNVPKGGGRFTPRYAVFREGWRVVPEDVSHVLGVTGEQLTAEGGAGPDCFDLTPLSATSKVIIQYEPPAAEVILVSTGGVAVADVQAGLTAQGYTAGRAPLLDNLDAAVSAIPGAVWDEVVADHATPDSFGELQAGLAALTSQQIALVRDMHRLLGLEVGLIVEHGDLYIRAPADGSLINIQLTRVGASVVKQRL